MRSNSERRAKTLRVERSTTWGWAVRVSVSVTPSFRRVVEAVEAMTQLLRPSRSRRPARSRHHKNMDWPARELSEASHLGPEAGTTPEGRPAGVQRAAANAGADAAGDAISTSCRRPSTPRRPNRPGSQIRDGAAEQRQLAQMKADWKLPRSRRKRRPRPRWSCSGQVGGEAAGRVPPRTQMRLGPRPETKPAAAPKGPNRSRVLNYKDAPPDVRRQIERRPTLPSSMGTSVEAAEDRRDAETGAQAGAKAARRREKLI